MNKTRRLIARIGGNFGVSFFGPLVGGNATNSIFPGCITFEQTLIISIIAACITTGFAISKEAAAYGETKRD